jgi:cytochrome P450
MAISTTTILNVGCFVATVYTLKRLLSAKSHAQPLPPGPPGLPVINNMFDWPSVNEWETFTQWAQLYGPLTN